MKNITETIREKKAMLEAIECVLKSIENHVHSHEECLESYKATLARYIEESEYSESELIDLEDWVYANRKNDVNEQLALIDAYETIQKALEKLI